MLLALPTWPETRRQIWCRSHRADPLARQLADRHYNRQNPNSKQFVPPGSCCVFISQDAKAFWVTSAPIAQYVKHAWAGAWVCSAFRNEASPLATASQMISLAIAATRHHYDDRIPDLGMVTFVDRTKVKPTIVRGKPTWGWTYMRAGFSPCGATKGGLLAFQMLPDKMPPRLPAN